MVNDLLSRRDFIKAAGLTLGAGALACTGAGCAVQNQLATPEVETPTYQYGKEDAMTTRILVAYATRTGSTVGVASAVGETLASRGYGVDVKPIKDNPSSAGYQMVLLGSAINGGQWLPEALAYVKDQQAALQQIPVALFCVHIMNTGADENSTKNRLAYLAPIRALVKPVNEGFFAGMGMNPEKESGLVRWVYRTFNIGPEGDCRDWTKIRAWAQALPVSG